MDDAGPLKVSDGVTYTLHVKGRWFVENHACKYACKKVFALAAYVLHARTAHLVAQSNQLSIDC